MTIGTYLKQQRERLELTTRQAASKAKVSYSMLSHYERDLAMPGFDKAVRLCEAYKVNIKNLIDELKNVGTK